MLICRKYNFKVKDFFFFFVNEDFLGSVGDLPTRSWQQWLSLSHISLTNQCTLIILYYTIQFSVKVVRHVSNPYFGIIIRDLDCELHKLQINNNGTL
jgi:hypothetical protein